MRSPGSRVVGLGLGWRIAYMVYSYGSNLHTPADSAREATRT